MYVTEGKERKRTVRGVITFCSKSLPTYKTMTFQNPEGHSQKDLRSEDSKISEQKQKLFLARINTRKLGLYTVQREILFSGETSQKQNNTKQLACNRD